MHGTQQNYIGGTWVPAVAAAPNVNPSNLNDVIADYARAQPVEIDTAVAAATVAFAAYSRSTPQERFDALKKISDEILARKGSSYGSREQGRYAVEFYTAVKTAYTQP
jgi:alpha-ketoglutaric semialdehyde dehydrogenase